MQPNTDKLTAAERREESRRRVKSAMIALALEYPIEFDSVHRNPEYRQRLDSERREMALGK